MGEDAPRGSLAPGWCDELDFPTLARMNAEYVGADLPRRLGGMVWRVAFRPGSPSGGPSLANGKRPCLLVLFEFQDGVVPDRAWRMHEKGLREGYHARVQSPGGRHGNEALPPFEELERRRKERQGGRELATLMEARTRGFEERAIARGIARGREQDITRGRAGKRAAASFGGAPVRSRDDGAAFGASGGC